MTVTAWVFAREGRPSALAANLESVRPEMVDMTSSNLTGLSFLSIDICNSQQSHCGCGSFDIYLDTITFTVI
jgi:hypothetical protein